MIVYSRASDPRARTSSNVSRFVSRPVTPVTRARSTGISRDWPAPLPGIGQKRAHALDLFALDVDEEHVRRVLGNLHRELLEQARLQRADADDEERAEADREQDDARLVPGPRQVQHRMPERKRRRQDQRREEGDQAAAGELQDDRQRRKAAADDRTDPQRSGLPARDGDERRARRAPSPRFGSSRAGAGPPRRAAAATVSRSARASAAPPRTAARRGCRRRCPARRRSTTGRSPPRPESRSIRRAPRESRPAWPAPAPRRAGCPRTRAPRPGARRPP